MRVWSLGGGTLNSAPFSITRGSVMANIGKMCLFYDVMTQKPVFSSGGRPFPSPLPSPHLPKAHKLILLNESALLRGFQMLSFWGFLGQNRNFLRLFYFFSIKAQG